MNAALTAWLMTPEAPGVPMTLEEQLLRPQWHQWAACRGVGADAYVPAVGGHYSRHQRELCASCPVRPECLEVALADRELVGLWGGTTPAERKVLRRGVVPARRTRRRRKDEREVELRWAEGELVDDEDELAHSADWSALDPVAAARRRGVLA